MNGHATMRRGAASRGSALCRVGVTICLAVVFGCVGSPWPGLGLDQRGHDSFDARRFGPTPAERAQQLRSTAELAKTLSSTQQQAVSEQLVARLGEETNPMLRCELVRTMSAFVTPGTISGLHAALADTEPDVRIAACAAWRSIGGEAATRALGQTLRNDSSIDVRLAAARSLGFFPAPESLRALAEALDDADPALRRRARLSLAKATGKDLGENPGLASACSDRGKHRRRAGNKVRQAGVGR